MSTKIDKRDDVNPDEVEAIKDRIKRAAKKHGVEINDGQE